MVPKSGIPNAATPIFRLLPTTTLCILSLVSQSGSMSSSFLHSSQPSIKLKSQKLIEKTRNERPFAEQPPSKRPRVEFAAMTAQRRSMATYVETDLRRLLWANDESTIDELQEELLHNGLEWTLDDSLLVPLCKEDEECLKCDAYHEHLMRRMARDDEEDPSDDENTMQTDSQESEVGAREIEFKSESMQKLLKLRNLRARLEAYLSDDAHSMGQLQGMVVQLNYDKVRAEGDRDRANAAWSIADADLESLKKSHQTLTESYEALKRTHESAIEEIRSLKQQIENSKRILHSD
jgi:hypothetical protein